MYKEKTLIKKMNIQKKDQNQNLIRSLTKKNQTNIKTKENTNQHTKLRKKLSFVNKPKTRHTQKFKNKKN